MGTRFRRALWKIRTIPTQRLAGCVFVVAAAVVIGAILGGWPAAVLGGFTGLILAGAILAPPSIGSRLLVEPPPWRESDGSLWFAGADLAFTPWDYAGDAAPDSIGERLTALGGRFEGGQVSLELWLVATDENGSPWTIVQERTHGLAGRRIWTASADAGIGFSDHDESGRPDPHRAAHRIARLELDIPLEEVQMLAWGREELGDGDRDVIVGMAYTSVAAEALSGFAYLEARVRRAAHLVPLTEVGVAKALGWGHPSHWHGGSALGLLEALEHLAPGSWAAVERAVAPRWYDKDRFAPGESGTESPTGQARAADPGSVTSAWGHTR